jgi:uncharacterized membrane protein YeiH
MPSAFVMLAEITALGGGILRDVLIGATPPGAFTNLAYLLVPVVPGVGGGVLRDTVAREIPRW